MEESECSSDGVSRGRNPLAIARGPPKAGLAASNTIKLSFSLKLKSEWVLILENDYRSSRPKRRSFIVLFIRFQ